MVAGYVVMRVAMVFQWLRAARQDPDRRSACLTYATAISVAQVGWIALLVAQTSVLVTFLWAALLVLVELAGPVIAERRKGGTPWHPHHIAERYGLLVIIALGEVCSAPRSRSPRSSRRRAGRSTSPCSAWPGRR